MGRSIHDVLLALGAKGGRDAQHLVLDLSLLDIRSVFGGDLNGDAVVQVSSPEAFAFQRPPELAACGTLWLPGVDTAEALAQAIVDAHDHVKTRLDDDQQTLKRLGMKPKLVAPDPRARAKASVSGRNLQVAIDGNGDIVVEEVDGKEIPADVAAAVSAPDDADGGEAMRRLEEVIEKLEANGVFGGDAAGAESFAVDVDMEESNPGVEAGDGGAWAGESSRTLGGDRTVGAKVSTQHLSDEQLAELHAALDDESVGLDDDDEDDDEDDAIVDEEMIDASDEAEAAIDEQEPPEPTVSVASRSEPPRIDPDEEEPKTVTVSLSKERKQDSLLAALELEDDDGATERAHTAGAADDIDVDEAQIGDDDSDDPTSSLAPQETQQLQTQTRQESEPPDRAFDRKSDRGVGRTDRKQPPLEIIATSASSEMKVDDFPALPADSEDNEPAPTSVNRPDTVAAAVSEPSTPPTMALKAPARTSDEDVDAIADGFDDGEGRSQKRGSLTVENVAPETHVPTKATVSQPMIEDEEDELPPPLDENAEDEPVVAVAHTAPPVTTPSISAPITSPPAAAPPPDAADSFLDEDDVQTRAVSILGVRAQIAARRSSTDEERGSEDPDALEARAGALEEEARALRERAAEVRVQAKERAAREEAARVEAARVEAARVEAARVEAARVEAARVEAARVEAARVEAARVEAARVEAARVEAARIEAARVEAARVEAARVESARGESARIESARVESARVESARVEAARVEAARVEAARADARRQPPATSEVMPAVTSSSLPVAQSIEVEEVADSSSLEHTPPNEHDDDGIDLSDDGFSDDDDDDAARPAGDATRGLAAPTRASDEGVSLAEVQAALGDLASLPGEATQVGALRSDGEFDARQHPLSSEGGDVFSSAPSDAKRGRDESGDDDDDDAFEIAIGSGGRLGAASLLSDAAEGPATKPPPPATPPSARATAPADDDEEGTEQAVVQGGTGAIGLVVEDARARDRLRKHLSPRFKELVEAPDASTAASLPDVARLEAIVFVRPRPDDATREGLELLCGNGRHPRILVISSDESFDEMPEVNLRLPLGQRASEVAQQVIDGLRELGVESVDGVDLE